MTTTTAPRAARRWLVVAVLVTVLAAVLGAALGWYRLGADAGAEVVTGAATREGWQRIEYRNVRVDLPDTWERSDLDGCEFEFEHWAPPQAAPCGRGDGVAFYASATFDPAHRPGVRRTDGPNDGTTPRWAGYVRVGEVAVYASTDDRDVVEAILGSARAG